MIVYKTPLEGGGSIASSRSMISLLDGYSFANVHVKGIVAFKHLQKNCDLDINHRPLKH